MEDVSVGSKVVMTWQWAERKPNGEPIRLHVFTVDAIDQYGNATLEQNELHFTCPVKDLQVATDVDVAFAQANPSC
jgi:hypothetical protein